MIHSPAPLALVPNEFITPEVESLLDSGKSTDFELATLAAIKANEAGCVCKFIPNRPSELDSSRGISDLESIDARELALERKQEELLDHRITLLWHRCKLLMEAKRFEEAKPHGKQADILALGRSAGHERRRAVAKGLIGDLEGATESAGSRQWLEPNQEATHA